MDHLFYLMVWLLVTIHHSYSGTENQALTQSLLLCESSVSHRSPTHLDCSQVPKASVLESDLYPHHRSDPPLRFTYELLTQKFVQADQRFKPRGSTLTSFFGSRFRWLKSFIKDDYSTYYNLAQKVSQHSQNQFIRSISQTIQNLGPLNGLKTFSDPPLSISNQKTVTSVIRDSLSVLDDSTLSKRDRVWILGLYSSLVNQLPRLAPQYLNTLRNSEGVRRGELEYFLTRGRFPHKDDWNDL